MNFYNSVFLSAYDPLVTGGSHYYLKNESFNSYKQTITASHGFDSMSCTVVLSDAAIEDWIVNGLGRHIEVTGIANQIVWEGFVNQITVRLGTLTVSVGPLTDITNRCSCVYTPLLDVSVDPPIKGDQTETIINEDTDSQLLYGIWEKILSVGEVIDDGSGTDNDAEVVRDTYLAEYKTPFTSNELNIGGSGAAPEVSLDCLGYYTWLSAYVYNYVTTPISTTADVKIGDVLDADPNSFFSSTNGTIDYNPTLVPSYEDENRFANDIIEGIVSLGDPSGVRWLFQVLEGRAVYYNEIPSDIYYRHSIRLRPNAITRNKSDVPLWEVRPAHWLLINDMITGTGDPAEDLQVLRADPRMMFIESASFTAPDSLSLAGDRVNTVQQKINRLGVAGML